MINREEVRHWQQRQIVKVKSARSKRVKKQRIYMHAQKGEKVKEMNRNDCDIIIEVMHSLELRECPAVLEQLADGSRAFNTDFVPAKTVQQNTGRGDRR